MPVPAPPAAPVLLATHAAKPARSFPKKSQPCMQLLPACNSAPCNSCACTSPLHASAPTHVVDARLVPADAHAGGNRYARGDRICMRPLPTPAYVAT
jgi:hypothetical protein